MAILLRFLGSVFLLVGVIALVYDGTRTMAANHMVTTPLAEHWSRLAPASLAGAQKAVRSYTHPAVWELGVGRLLQLPAWAVLGGIGLLAGYAGRRRRRVNVFAN